MKFVTIYAATLCVAFVARPSPSAPNSSMGQTNAAETERSREREGPLTHPLLSRAPIAPKAPKRPFKRMPESHHRGASPPPRLGVGHEKRSLADDDIVENGGRLSDPMALAVAARCLSPRCPLLRTSRISPPAYSAASDRVSFSLRHQRRVISRSTSTTTIDNDGKDVLVFADPGNGSDIVAVLNRRHTPAK